MVNVKLLKASDTAECRGKAGEIVEVTETLVGQLVERGIAEITTAPATKKSTDKK